MLKKLILYTTVFAGCFFEGETSLVTSAFAAHRGYLNIFIVISIAMIATLSWDWIWFMVGRIKGNAILAKRPKLEAKSRKINILLMQHQVAVLLGYRFLYGFRTAVPLAIGMSSVTKRRFLLFGLINVVIWDCLFSSLGYFFGAFLKANWKRIEDYEIEILVGILITGLITGFILRRRSVRKLGRNLTDIP